MKANLNLGLVSSWLLTSLIIDISSPFVAGKGFFFSCCQGFMMLKHTGPEFLSFVAPAKKVPVNDGRLSDMCLCVEEAVIFLAMCHL